MINNGTHHVVRNVAISSTANPLAKGIVAKATLHNCHIIAHIAGGEIGIDLDDSGVNRVGSGNVIWITTSNGTTTAADLPDSWTTTPDNSEVNDVRINGVRWYAP